MINRFIMTDADLDKYYNKGGDYTIPTEIVNDMTNAIEEAYEYIDKLEKKVLFLKNTCDETADDISKIISEYGSISSFKARSIREKLVKYRD